MKKIVIVTVLLVIILWWWVVYAGIKYKDKFLSTNIDTNSWILLSTNSWESEKQIKTENINENKKDKIIELRKRLALKWLILKWDLNLQNWDYTSALIKYLQINKEIPGDKSIILKLAEVNYNLKKFDKAYSYYSQIKDYNNIDKNLIAKILIYSLELNDENINYINKELINLWLNDDELFYYKTSFNCKKDFSECRKEFQNYFASKSNKQNKEWTWAIDNSEIKSQDLLNIKEAIENYDNFQLEDLDYKWALIAWAFFENWLYPIAIETSNAVLKSKNDYKPLFKIIAKSNYELWNYTQAKLYLIEYSNIDNNDDEINFFLGVVYEKIHEYILSTIHFNKAIELWYIDILDINKRILSNYYQLWEIDKMLETFKIILSGDKEKLTSNDYNLAIYYNIVNDKIKDAKEYTKEALVKYPKSEIFNWYMWWILMDEVNSKPFLFNTKTTSSWSTEKTSSWNTNSNKEQISMLFSEAESYINKWLELDSKSPMLNLVKWKLEMSKWEYKKSFLYLTKTVSLDPKWEFGEMAIEELKNIEINKQ